MSRGWKIFWITTIAVVVPFGTWAGLGIYALTQVCYQMAGWKLISVDRQFISFNIMIKVYNPSFLEVEIKGYDIAVALNNTPVANLKSDTKYTLGAKKSNILTLPVKIDYQTALDKAKSNEVMQYFLLQQYDKIILGMNGKFSGSLMAVPISMKIDFTYSLADIIKIMKEPDTPCPGLDQKKAA